MSFKKMVAAGLIAASVVVLPGTSAAAFPLNVFAGTTTERSPSSGQPEEDAPQEDAPPRNKGRISGNDSFSNAADIETIPFGIRQDTSSATLEEGEPQSCSPTATIWFSFTPDRDVDLTSVASGRFSPTVAVYSGDSLAALTPVGCAGGDGPTAAVTFAAEAGETYRFQVGSGDGNTGSVDFEVDLAEAAAPVFGDPGPLKAGWEEDVLLSDEVVITEEGQGISAPIVTIDGRPAADREYYDLSIEVLDTKLPKLSLYTAGKVRHEVHEELVTLLDEGTNVVVSLVRRYTSAATQCAAYAAEACVATVPVDPDDPAWVTGAGKEAELILSVAARIEGRAVAHTLRIPYAGQTGTLVP